ncbi:MAG: phosphatidylserine decarboxylase [Ruminococcaceae bacterium]|nr:phosphatidylserine decarboxylase [Oscillospiraceae bacterium]
MEIDMNQRPTNPFDKKLDSLFLRFLYRKHIGAPLRFLLTRRFVSDLGGAYMNSRLSRRRIPRFIQENSIQMDDYETREYTSFNDFFTRKILPGKRPFSFDPTDLCSPADSRLSVFSGSDQGTFTVKGTPYTLDELIQNSALAKEFQSAYILVFRLCVDDYHRYAYIDDGTVTIPPRYIPGAFHTVRPIAFTDNRRVFCRNAREITVLETKNFGKVLQIEVGAMMVGRIVNHNITEYKRGDEKGYFAFGGSTVILVIKKNAVDLDPCFLENTRQGLETRVFCGETIGQASHTKEIQQ